MSVNNVNQEQVQTREQYKKAKLESFQTGEVKEKSAKMTKTEASVQVNKRIRIRLIPIWLRLFLLVVFVAISVMAGAAVGYGVLGDGKPADIFKESTWTHIRDLVEKGK